MLTNASIAPVVPAADDGSAIEKVIRSDMCVGCGSCAFARPDAFAMRFNSFGHWTAEISQTASADDLVTGSRLCPMSGDGADEDAISGALYPALPSHPEIGRHDMCGAAAVSEGDYRPAGSSGGLTTWLLAELLAAGEITAVIHVTPVAGAGDDPLFQYSISTSLDEVRARAKSRYHSVEMSGVLQQLERYDGAVAVVGTPCFIKALRSLCDDRPAMRAKLRYCVALVCGHQKSRRYADLLAHQLGVEPGRLIACDFRKKLIDRPASDYAFQAVGPTGNGVVETHSRPMDQLIGGNWGQGFMKLTACDFCDDVVGECADVSIGDAWLPGFVNDHRGTNVVVVRDRALSTLLNGAIVAGRVEFAALPADAIADSQRGGLNHRREGLAFRLHYYRKHGWWAPAKRVRPSNKITPQRRRIYRARMIVARETHQLYQRLADGGRLNELSSHMRRLQAAYVRETSATLPERLARKVRSFLSILRPRGR